MASEVQSICPETPKAGGRLFRMLSRIASFAPEGTLARAAPSLPIVLNQFFNSAANFVVTVLLLRLLGLAEFGNYTLYYVVALSTIAVLASLITSPAVSIAATLDAEHRREVLTAAGALVIGGVTGIVALLFCAELLGVDIGLHLIPFAALLAAIALSEQARRFLLFSRKLVLAWAFDLFRFGLLIGMLVFAMGSEHNAQSAMLMIATAFALPLAALTVFLITRHHILSFADFLAHSRRVLATGRWLSISSLLDFVSANAFLFAGSIVLGSEAVGIVRACSAVAGLVNPFVLVLEHIFPRHIGQLVGEHGWRIGLRKYYGAAAWAAAAIAAVLAFLAVFAEPLLGIVAGADVSRHAWVLQGLVLAWVPYTVVSLVILLLRAMEKTGVVAASWAISAAVAALLAFPLVNALGIAGIVLGTILITLINAKLLLVAYVRVRRSEVQA
jgi:O-antigen/teichoic acid export membrane protein